MSRTWRRAAVVCGAAMVVLLAVAAVVVPYRPVRAAGAAPPAAPYTLPPGVAGLKLHVFNTGMNRMSSVLVGENRPWRPAPAFVLEHPKEGLLVFDCGLSEAVAREGESALPIPLRWLFESRGRPGRTLDAQMREARLDPARARWVIVSHLHDDHVGVARAFRAATFIGGPGTAGHAIGSFKPSWRESMASESTSPLPPFGAAEDLFTDGSIWLLRGGGHAREDIMALISLPSGPALLTGDAAVHRDWLMSEDVQRVAVDPQRAADVRDQIRSLARATPELLLLFGHDLDGLPRDRADVVLHHPEWFEAAAWPVSP